MPRRVAFIAFLIIFTFESSQALADTIQKYDGRFVGTISKDVIVLDSSQMISNANVSIEWWTLLGQAVEIYGFKWQSTGKIRVGNTVLERSHLQAYPSLVKRFDALQPSNVEIELDIQPQISNFYANEDTFVAGSELYVREKRKEKTTGIRRDQEPTQYRYRFSGKARYTIPDHKLLYGPADSLGKDIMPRSPRNWNDFIEWMRVFSINYQGVQEGQAINVSRNKFDSLSKLEQQKLERNLAGLFKAASAFNISATIKVQWAESEVQRIKSLLKEYQTGEKLPPSEELAARKGSTSTTRPYAGDSEWAQAELVEPGYDIVERDGLTGVVSKYGTELFPFGPWVIKDYRAGTAKVEKSDRVVLADAGCGQDRAEEVLKGWINRTGAWLDPPLKMLRITHRYLPEYLPNITLGVGECDSMCRERQARQRREEAERFARRRAACEEELNSLRERAILQYKSDGYVVE